MPGHVRVQPVLRHSAAGGGDTHPNPISIISRSTSTKNWPASRSTTSLSKTSSGASGSWTTNRHLLRPRTPRLSRPRVRCSIRERQNEKIRLSGNIPNGSRPLRQTIAANGAVMSRRFKSRTTGKPAWNAFYIIEAIILGGVDVRTFPLAKRSALCTKFANTLNLPLYHLSPTRSARFRFATSSCTRSLK